LLGIADRYAGECRLRFDLDDLESNRGSIGTASRGRIETSVGDRDAVSPPSSAMHRNPAPIQADRRCTPQVHRITTEPGVPSTTSDHDLA
jgi:hypothetical protein